ncbi:MAG: hypothetical protein FWH55_01350 [Oscillospiraceae bacterium]|nr:hypothetical protein [Oscillospiraceae bacterium]
MITADGYGINELKGRKKEKREDGEKGEDEGKRENTINRFYNEIWRKRCEMTHLLQ